MAQNQFIIIRPNILQDKDLTSTDKLILAYIVGIWRSAGPFYASNQDISSFLGISKRQVIRSIAKMEQLGYFTIRHSKDANLFGNDIRIIEGSTKNKELFDKLGQIILSAVKKK